MGLKQLREQAELTQQQLADRMTTSGYAISRQTIGDIENGKSRLSGVRADYIANALGVTRRRLLHLCEPTESEIKNPSAPSPALLKRASTAYAACGVEAEPHTSGWGGDMLDSPSAQDGLKYYASAALYGNCSEDSPIRTAWREVMLHVEVPTLIQRVEKSLREKKPAPVPSDVYGYEDDTRLIAAGIAIILLAAVAVLVMGV